MNCFVIINESSKNQIHQGRLTNKKLSAVNCTRGQMYCRKLWLGVKDPAPQRTRAMFPKESKVRWSLFFI